MTKIVYLILLFALLPWGSAWARDAVKCEAELSPPIFEISQADLALVEKVRAIDQKIRASKTKKQQLLTRIPELSENLLRMDLAIQAIQPEIEMILEETRNAYPNWQTVAATENFDGRMQYQGWHLSKAQGLLNIDFTNLLKFYRANFQTWAQESPTLAQVLYSGDTLAVLLTDLMQLRKFIMGHEEKALTKAKLQSYLAKNGGDIVLSSFFFGQFRILTRKCDRNGWQTNLQNVYGRILSCAKFMAAGNLNGELYPKKDISVIPFVAEDLISIDVFNELAWQNLQLIQVMPEPKFKTIDGSIEMPERALEHDYLHYGDIKKSNEQKSREVLIRFVQAVKKDHPAWMPLLRALIFTHRHEEGDGIDKLPKMLKSYLSTAPEREERSYSLYEATMGILKELKAESLEPQWNAFIHYLETIQK